MSRIQGQFLSLSAGCAGPTPGRRDLCAATPAYYDKLSPASVMTLEVQGGPMNEQEMADFRELPGHRMALQVRVYDDPGKEPQMERPELEHYIPQLKACFRDHS